jgi:hypothetical protein
MQERRKFKRRFIMYYTRIFDRSTGAVLGYLVDLSSDGAMVVSEDPLTPGVDYRLRMDIPEDFSSKGCLDFEARCVWSRPDTDPRFYDSGFQLLGISEADEALIERMIQEYGFRDG